jgi:hypothetical protein
MKKDDEYVGEENEKWFYVNKRVVIHRDDGIPYLIRRTLLSIGRFFSIKYHQILQSDDACPHDHPWPFLTIILGGGYFEWTPYYQKEKGEILAEQVGYDGIKEVLRYHAPGSIMYRPATWIHRLELKLDGKNIVPAKTLVFTGRVLRDWGFLTKEGWIFWRKYSRQNHCQ